MRAVEANGKATKGNMKNKTKMLVGALAMAMSVGFVSAQEKPDGPPRGQGQGREQRGGPQGGPGGEGQRGGGPGGDGQRPMVPPIIAALDSNSDGVIDEVEINQAAASLRKLDKNGDGKLTMDELRPSRPGGSGGGPDGQRGPGGPGGQGGQGKSQRSRPAGE